MQRQQAERDEFQGIQAEDLVRLDPDHPGFRDARYRERRNAIAQLAMRHVPGTPVPRVEYTPREQHAWSEIWRRLAPLHRERVCRPWLDLQEQLGLAHGPIPQIEALNAVLEERTGSRMEPVAGLVSARVFLERLGARVLLSTQYMRHPSRPFYTPEPDLVHEFVGHAATLAHPRITRVHELFGLATRAADEPDMLRLERAYWYTLEFGLVQQNGELRAFGAGLLSSVGELEQFDAGPELLALDLERAARTEYDPTAMQPRLFVAPSFDDMLAALEAWLRSGRWRRKEHAGLRASA
jgi:phenylalanine-4-hydroxylase